MCIIIPNDRSLKSPPDMSTCSRSVWERSDWSGAYAYLFLTYANGSSAKDQLSSTSVAIKKIMKPFSTPVLSKRTYRELKLLKHLRHENVSCPCPTGVWPG